MKVGDEFICTETGALLTCTEPPHYDSGFGCEVVVAETVDGDVAICEYPEGVGAWPYSAQGGGE